jgi:hypothetical protein
MADQVLIARIAQGHELATRMLYAWAMSGCWIRAMGLVGDEQIANLISGARPGVK